MPEPEDKMLDAVYQLDTCDHCPYVIKRARAYEKHLAREHPEGEKR